jgi:hypothetical protein
VLEHVKNPFTVVDEIYRISEKGGSVLVYTPFLYPYHGNRRYKDYYRFSHDGLLKLFHKWKKVELQPVRGYFETLALLLPRPITRILTPPFRFVDKYFKLPQVSGYYLFALK